jgi:hypothetical protein
MANILEDGHGVASNGLVNEQIAGQTRSAKITDADQGYLQIAEDKYTKFGDLFQERTANSIDFPPWRLSALKIGSLADPIS